ncbi:LuxR C-terminal-related transcriptional regulator [Sphingorhabdus sp. Alg231-15]|uniref:LuxR C-terminal-related transcriptional regulator n=1 Tax=Sphingorhabdus sp. Alg231-15 TaxID=1922222 RepID=UPI000D55060A
MHHALNLRNDPVLTRREAEILKYVALGLSAKEVARQVEISPRTVDRHIENIRLKLRAKNRTHMVACAVRAGFLELMGGEVRAMQF